MVSNQEKNYNMQFFLDCNILKFILYKNFKYQHFIKYFLGSETVLVTHKCTYTIPHLVYLLHLVTEKLETSFTVKIFYFVWRLSGIKDLHLKIESNFSRLKLKLTLIFKITIT